MSLLQRHDSKLISLMSKSTSESASMILFVNAMTHSLSLFYLISESDLPCVHLQLVSLLQWHDQNQSLQWASRFSSSESATKTLSMQWSIYSHRFIYQWINLSCVSVSTSESASMTWSESISSMSKSIST